VTTPEIPSAVFADTSGLYAALDADDHHHEEAATILGLLVDQIVREEVAVVTHGSVVVEVVALVQHRIGMAAVRAVVDDILPMLEIEWVDGPLHEQAVTGLLAADRRGVSLVDWTSFVVMRRRSIDTAFAFDDDFVRQGFALIEAS
jgi:predicted nucleic acid-binding protein